MNKKRPVTITGDIAQVPLTQGQTSIISACRAAEVGAHNWCAGLEKDTQQYTARSTINGKQVYLHQFLMGFPGGFVDHIDNDTLNNRDENLRVVTHKQNMENRKGAYRKSQTGIRGVSPKSTKSGHTYYQGQVEHNGRNVGKSFPQTPEGLELASRWVIEKRLELHTHSDGR